MTEVQEFLDTFIPRQEKADHALHNGDPGSRTELWSREDPVTVLGALGVAASGWEQVSEAFRWVPSQFSNAESFRLPGRRLVRGRQPQRGEPQQVRLPVPLHGRVRRL